MSFKPWMILILKNIEMSRSNFIEMKSRVIFCKKKSDKLGFFVFSNRVNEILGLSQDFIKGISVFSGHEMY